MWPFSQPKGVDGQSQAAFDHARVYQEIHGGAGAGSLSEAAWKLAGPFRESLLRVEELVHSALRRCRGSWTGDAAEAMESETVPFRRGIQVCEDLSSTLSNGVKAQGEHFDHTRHAMPPPYPVPPLDLDFADVVPTNLAAKLAGQEIHEARHNVAEQKARDEYLAYRAASKYTLQSLQSFPAVPSSSAVVGVSDARRPGNVVNPRTDRHANVAWNRFDRTAPEPAAPVHRDGGTNAGRADVPAQTGTAWAGPLAGLDGAKAVPGAGAGGAVVGGAVTGGAAGGAVPIPRSGSGSVDRCGGWNDSRGRVGGGLRTGRGSGAGGAVGSGGGAMRGGPEPAGVVGDGRRDPRGSEKHRRKYVKNTDEHFEFHAEVDPNTGELVAPPVIGDDDQVGFPDGADDGRD
ncbi:hypothetical protein GCM10009545_37170 [Saccharopolyspora thermophila]|uniref:PPE family protein n=1 Tax=Saccharopolyspora thermophila TaxID=89367 RepID=A0ABN1D0U0_9PSEU